MTLLQRIQCVLSLGLVIGCVDVQGPEMETLQPNDVLAEVKIRSSAIMIEKGDSQQVAFDLIAMDESRIPVDWNNIKWTSLESQFVSVSQTGVIQGVAVSSSPIFVAVQYVHKYVTKTDTVSVYVTDGRIDANEIKLVALDSTRVGGHGIIGGAPRVRVDLYKNGSLVTKGSLIPIQTDPPAVAAADGQGGPDGEAVYRISNPLLLIGKFWIRSSLNLYGNEVNDSVSFTGLYSDFVTPAVGISTVDPNNAPSIPILDTMPLNTYQLCAGQLILNFSMDTVDIVYSDSTATAAGCAPGDGEILTSLGLLSHGITVGGNVLNVLPFSVALRKSNTLGDISYTVRKSSTKEPLPWFQNHFRQRDVED